MNFGMITLNQSISKIQNYATWIQIALLFVVRLKISKGTLQMMLKKDLIHQMMKSIDSYQEVKMKK